MQRFEGEWSGNWQRVSECHICRSAACLFFFGIFAAAQVEASNPEVFFFFVPIILESTPDLSHSYM